MVARRYNSGKPMYSLIKLSALEPLAHVLEYGRDKYSDFTEVDGVEVRVYDARDNWDNGLVLSEVIDSMMRHIASIQDGEWIDEESKLAHIGHIQANAMFLGSKNIVNDLTK